MRRLASLALCASLLGCVNFDEGYEQCFQSGRCLSPEPPTLVETTPAGGATDIDVLTVVSVRFSKAMARESVTLSFNPGATVGAPEWTEEDQVATWSLISPLGEGTTYDVLVAGTDQEGAALANQTAFSFTTRPPRETTPPTVTATVPLPGAVNVSVGATLQLTFSEPLEPESLLLTVQPELDLGTPTFSNGGKTAVFDPPTDLPFSTEITLQLQGTDLAGNAFEGVPSLTFTTQAAPDADPPEVVETTPVAGSVSVSTSAPIAIGFSEPMDKTVTPASFVTISPSVSCTFTWDAEGRLLTCAHPGTPFASSTAYSVTVGTGARDLSGNTLAASFNYGFTTGATADVTPPTVTGVSPVADATGVSRAANISVTFSEPMDKAQTQNAFSVISPGGITGTFTWSADGRTMTFNPTGDLPVAAGATPNITYAVGAGARDYAGNALTYTERRFRTVRQANNVVVLSIPGQDGYVGRKVNTDTYVTNTTSASLYTGQSSTSYSYRSFLSFPAPTPTPARIISATVDVYQNSVTGSPYTKLGNASLGLVSYKTLDSAAYPPTTGVVFCQKFDPDCSVVTLSSTASTGWKSTVVTAFAQARGASAGLQFRITMPVDNAYLSENNYATFVSGDATGSLLGYRPKLTLTYEYD